MVIYASKGLVVFLGCGHAGLINTLDDAQQIVGPSPIHAAIGRFHLLKASGEHLEWTAKERVDLGLANFIGAHCSGLEPVYRFLELTSLGGASSVVGAFGATFSITWPCEFDISGAPQSAQWGEYPI
ncbi:hypothetical protein N8611_01970 [bacterium]|nr:hypothetical protein [bacterium]